MTPLQRSMGLMAEAESAREEVERLRAALSRQDDEICQTLGQALGYPRFQDDQANFPGATEADGICVGDHVAASIAAEAANEIRRLRAELEAARKPTPRPDREALGRIAYEGAREAGGPPAPSWDDLNHWSRERCCRMAEAVAGAIEAPPAPAAIVHVSTMAEERIVLFADAGAARAYYDGCGDGRLFVAPGTPIGWHAAGDDTGGTSDG